MTAIVLLTSWRVFYGNPQPVTLETVGDVARQLEPSFGASAKVIFCGGILAGALSSFLVNALIGGTVMSDAIGKGSRLQDKWPVHMTVVALLVGMVVAIAGLQNKESVVPLITLAQACTVVGLPALAAALLYLGTRPELTGARKVPRPILVTATIGLVVACLLMFLLAQKVYAKLSVTEESVATVAAATAVAQVSLSVDETVNFSQTWNTAVFHARRVRFTSDPAITLRWADTTGDSSDSRRKGTFAHDNRTDVSRI